MFTKFIYWLRKQFSSMKVKLLSVGVENSRYAITLPGASKGETKLFSKLKPRCDYAKLLIDAEATKTRVLYEMQNVCDSDLAVITFNCHGGQKYGKQNETDNMDEFLALYDGPLVDNEIWNVISKAKGRVLLVFDCCHSETMFRNVDKFLTDRDGKEPDILVWSACADKDISYALADYGGTLTLKLVKKISWWKTYSSIWKSLLKDKSISKLEKIRQTMLLGENSKFNKKLFLT